MTPKQTNTFQEEIREILVEYKKDYGGNDFGLDKADKALSALFQKVVDKACNENDVTCYYFGPRDYEMAKMNVIETKKRIRASFKDIVEGRETI